MLEPSCSGAAFSLSAVLLLVSVGLILALRDRGCTVFFSSHVLSDAGASPATRSPTARFVTSSPTARMIPEDEAVKQGKKRLLEAVDVTQRLEIAVELQRDRLARGLYCVKDRAKTFPELLEKAQFAMTSRPVSIDEAAAKNLDTVSRGILKSLTPRLQNASWTKEGLEPILTQIAEAHGIGFGKLAAPLRTALAGRSATPSVYDMMLVIGRDETIARLEEAAG